MNGQRMGSAIKVLMLIGCMKIVRVAVVSLDLFFAVSCFRLLFGLMILFSYISTSIRRYFLDADQVSSLKAVLPLITKAKNK